MLIEKDLNKLLNGLVQGEDVKIQLEGFNVSVKLFDRGRGLFLSTPVYFGGNYIPKSVRGCLKHKPPFNSKYIQASLEIDEDNYLVLLNHKGFIDHISRKNFTDRLEDFVWLAEKWRDYLDEHDKHDLVYIYAT